LGVEAHSLLHAINAIVAILRTSADPLGQPEKAIGHESQNYGRHLTIILLSSSEVMGFVANK
jgi:hypothetical protein